MTKSFVLVLLLVNALCVIAYADEPDDQAFLSRFGFNEEDVLFSSKYSRRVAVNADKETLTKAAFDAEVSWVYNYEYDFVLENGMTDAQVYAALEQYLVNNGSIDHVGAVLALLKT